MSIIDDITEDTYKPALTYPTRPSRPSVLNKRATDLSPEEIASLTATKKAYEDALSDYDSKRGIYGLESARLRHQFETDLLAHHGIGGRKASLAVGYAIEDADGDYVRAVTCFEKYAEIL